MEKLTSGQRAATRMILETSDRFTVVQGYAGVGKTTQFRAVMSAVNMLPESERPRVVGLGPTHRAVGGDAQRRRGCTDTGVLSA
ncbi:AAA family ATPase [Escherichia coli]|nr:AAA family ATPase [Escherichia coli]